VLLFGSVVVMMMVDTISMSMDDVLMLSLSLPIYTIEWQIREQIKLMQCSG
jgi:hypothetical protein